MQPVRPQPRAPPRAPPRTQPGRILPVNPPPVQPKPNCVQVNIDYEKLADTIVDRHADRLRGADGADGAPGAAGPIGPAGPAGPAGADGSPGSSIDASAITAQITANLAPIISAAVAAEIASKPITFRHLDYQTGAPRETADVRLGETLDLRFGPQADSVLRGN